MHLRRVRDAVAPRLLGVIKGAVGLSQQTSGDVVPGAKDAMPKLAVTERCSITVCSMERRMRSHTGKAFCASVHDKIMTNSSPP
jgi:hypothetical protein